ncbi:MAG: methionine--tRNA ligase [Deltaproteobacteria bacterium]|nr:methionine--tRNA ligase [Deltaproteobacteria bacterium]
MSRILVTSALPYANGSIHIGHLVEYIQTDIFVRFLKLIGENAIYLCASDTHGTPIEVNARKLGITPEELVEMYHREHFQDFRDFEIMFDDFYTTNSPECERHAVNIYSRLKEKGHIYTREIEQSFCSNCQRFLPDRFIRGTCPNCNAHEQYGDVCETCNSTYNPTELRDARCAICGTTPVTRKSLHYFFRLSDFADFLKSWTIEDERLQPEVVNKVREWFDRGLEDWDISRDGPYFGFKIPGEENKYFYVWLDAPVGYVATTEHYCLQKGLNFDAYWFNPDTRIYHFIGKDIMYFHVLFWPAMLHGADYNTPSNVFIHGFLTVDGKKMSKSRGTFITARKYLEFLKPQFLRYYYASKLGNGVDDIDLNLSEFVHRVNAELVNKIANLVSRTVNFVNKQLEGRLGPLPPNISPLVQQVEEKRDLVHEHYAGRNFSKAIREICGVADIANTYLQETAPFHTIKTDREAARSSCTFAINCVKIIAIMLKPVVPSFSLQVEEILRLGDLQWKDARFDLEMHTIGPFVRLIDRMDEKEVLALVEASKETLGGETDEEKPSMPPIKEEITIDDFSRMDIRAGEVISAETVEGADNLLRLTLDIGVIKKTVLAGLAKDYRPEDLVGRTLLVVANLKPRKTRFGVSDGMILAGGPAHGNLVVAELIDPIPPGSPIT